MIKQAIIPLAGLGTRLLPLTSVFAKELLPINGKPGIEYILDECIDAGIKEIIFIISEKKKIELPVFEEVQMGIAIGLAMEGYLPVTCYPRFDFLILAMNQLINHLDKVITMSRYEMNLTFFA